MWSLRKFQIILLIVHILNVRDFTTEWIEIQSSCYKIRNTELYQNVANIHYKVRVSNLPYFIATLIRVNVATLLKFGSIPQSFLCWNHFVVQIQYLIQSFLETLSFVLVDFGVFVVIKIFIRPKPTFFFIVSSFLALCFVLIVHKRTYLPISYLKVTLSLVL